MDVPEEEDEKEEEFIQNHRWELVWQVVEMCCPS